MALGDQLQSLLSHNPYLGVHYVLLAVRNPVHRPDLFPGIPAQTVSIVIGNEREPCLSLVSVSVRCCSTGSSLLLEMSTLPGMSDESSISSIYRM